MVKTWRPVVRKYLIIPMAVDKYKLRLIKAFEVCEISSVLKEENAV